MPIEVGVDPDRLAGRCAVDPAEDQRCRTGNLGDGGPRPPPPKRIPNPDGVSIETRVAGHVGERQQRGELTQDCRTLLPAVATGCGDRIVHRKQRRRVASQPAGNRPITSNT